MTNEELLDSFEIASKEYNGPKLTDLRAEILKLMELGAAVSASPQPRCPKCQSTSLDARVTNDVSCGVYCRQCKRDVFIHKLEDYAQFFAAAPAQEPLRKLVTDKEPNGYPLWFNRAVHECPVCDSEDLCVKHLEMAEREFTGCAQEIEIFLAAFTHRPVAQEQPVENSPQEGKS